MNATSRKANTRWITLLAAAAVAAAGLAIWWYSRRVPSPQPPAAQVADNIAAWFYKSLAALDVEENQTAADALEPAVQAESREPALWANLAVARLRLRDLAGAGAALERASALLPDSAEIDLIRAEWLVQSGRTDEAINVLRQIHQQHADNMTAAYSLAALLEQERNQQADSERLSLLSAILERWPGNLRARCEQVRLAATLRRGDQLPAMLDAVDRTAAGLDLPSAATEQLRQAREALAAGDFDRAARALTFFENPLKPTPAYQQSLEELGVSAASAIGTPLRELRRLAIPRPTAAEPDAKLQFQWTPLDSSAPPQLVVGLPASAEQPALVLWLVGENLRAGDAMLPFPGPSADSDATSICAADLNSDFRQDLILVGAAGCRIYLAQPDGAFQPLETQLDVLQQPWRSVWAADVESDGDMDLILGDGASALRWIRNNGDLTFTAIEDFIDATNVRQLLSADWDRDGGVDLATVATSGTLTFWRNRRGGAFSEPIAFTTESVLAAAASDVDRDGRLDLVMLLEGGEIRQATWDDDGMWIKTDLVRGSAVSQSRQANLFVEDLDNNGAVDLISSTPDTTDVWLAAAQQNLDDAAANWTHVGDAPAMLVNSVTDNDADGLLDLVGQNDQGGGIAFNRSQAGYGWQTVQPMATIGAGDKRINSFGVGGQIEIRAGSLVQAALIQGPQVHFGLGQHRQVDLIRIVWPNGSFQAEFDAASRQTLVATQRLKGSCPWVFAFDGKDFHFVKDFIWRSPLGLRINAQDTAGVAQTLDQIKIPGSLLRDVDGRYHLRITAELWETHFFDHISLLAVDHPPDVELLVDERFVPASAAMQQRYLASPLHPLENLVDHQGRDVQATLSQVDGCYADQFALGAFQGVAEEHWIEFDLPDEADLNRHVLLVGNGWIYPTDSSLNVAIAQGGAAPPHGLLLEQQAPDGQWLMVRDDLGFPAGKNKDVVIALTQNRLGPSRRFRLRSNLEIYWDALGWSYHQTGAEPRVTTAACKVARLRSRGYSKLQPTDRRRPDTPLYQIEATQQRWLDLEGFYTRFGDVSELLTDVDDRYVIMNAGDELVLEYEAADLPSGWRRDFILVGDGWVKDGDFNTAFSRTVRPLPRHGDSQYAEPPTTPEQDPVRRQHPDDWRQYHTRYVTPRGFQRRLWTNNVAAQVGVHRP